MSLNQRKKSFSMNGRTLWIWGLLFTAAGIIGQCVIQNGVLGITDLTNQELVDKMADSSVFVYVTAALVLQAVQACAIPIFAMLTVEGFLHTSKLWKYMLRVGILALATEIPYNLAMGGGWWVTSSRNPVFGVLIALVMLALYRHYAGRGFKSIAINALVLIVGMLWMSMLDVADGGALVVMTSVFWFMRNKTQYRVFVAAIVMVLCCLLSPYYIVAPIAMMAIHFYNGEPSKDKRVVHYGAYPAMLLVIWAFTVYFV